MGGAEVVVVLSGPDVVVLVGMAGVVVVNGIRMFTATPITAHPSRDPELPVVSDEAVPPSPRSSVPLCTYTLLHVTPSSKTSSKAPNHDGTANNAVES